MDLEKEVEKIEIELMETEKQFTAIDVGNQLKRRGINVRQRQVSPIVRKHYTTHMYAAENYTRKSIPIKDGATKAYLYFGVEQNPDDYFTTNQDPLPWDPNKPVAGGINVVVSALYVASKRSKVFHGPHCIYALRIASHNHVSFCNEKEASCSNYRKCKRDC